MKKYLITLTVTVCLLLTSCVNVGRVIATNSTTVDHAMKAWSVYVVDGHATPEQEAKVKEAQLAYYAAEDLALDAYRTYHKTGDKTVYVIAAERLQAQSQNLVTLIQFLSKKEVK